MYDTFLSSSEGGSLPKQKEILACENDKGKLLIIKLIYYTCISPRFL